MAGKKRILSRQSNCADQVFDGIGVDFDPTVVQKGLQPAPLPMDIGQLLAEAGLRGDPAPSLGSEATRRTLQSMEPCGYDVPRGAGLS